MITTNGQDIIAYAGKFHTYIITTSQTWNVPSYAAILKITAIQGGAGGGGGGGASSTTVGMSGGGGQAGAVAEQLVTLNAADTQLTITIGAGGAGGAGGTGGSSPTHGTRGNQGGQTQVQGTQSGQLYAQVPSNANVYAFYGGPGGTAADAYSGPQSYYAFGFNSGYTGGSAQLCRPGDSSNAGEPMPYGLVIGGASSGSGSGGYAQQAGQPLGTQLQGTAPSGNNGGAGANATMPGCGGGGGGGGLVVSSVGGNGGPGGNGAPGMVIIEVIG